MHMNRREFLQMLAVAAASGMAMDSKRHWPAMYRPISTTCRAIGNVSLMHMTDCHAQLLPIYFREPNVNLGVGGAVGKAPHLVGEYLLKQYGIKPGSRRSPRIHLSRLHRGRQAPMARSADSPT